MFLAGSFARLLTYSQGTEEETMKILEESATIERVEIDENGGMPRFS